VPPALAISRIQVAQAKLGTLLTLTHHLEYGPDASQLTVFFNGGTVYAVSGMVSQAQRDPV